MIEPQYSRPSFGKTIVSPRGTFELGFFNLGNPNKSNLGILVQEYLVSRHCLVANGGNPINDSSALLRLKSSDHLVLTHNNTVVWSTSSPKEAKNPVAELLDSGNVVIREPSAANQEAYLWQSFDYPSNTMLRLRMGYCAASLSGVLYDEWNKKVPELDHGMALRNHGCLIQPGQETTATIMGFVEPIHSIALLLHQCEIV
ncbi:hypothetical protein JHK82_033751 [Glycine max]|nr:hypothetical protein JHK85_034466 [Glycine max]KAG4986142.1 hypothetical protein JHK86_033833 [Glycine max]KAG5119331.1 hypothetical protein JHK82_033751 [Glycine max]KAG5140323.1 hypothetical protein JHK84_034091 [Glycine max]